jgi:hypothetical protein
MGMAYKHVIERAGVYLLRVLAAENPIPYARFYDGTDATERALLVGMGYGGDVAGDDEDADDRPDSPAAYMDWAVGQLAAAGIVATRDTGGELADGEPAYEIELTEQGRRFIATGGRFAFRDMEL